MKELIVERLEVTHFSTQSYRFFKIFATRNSRVSHRTGRWAWIKAFGKTSVFNFSFWTFDLFENTGVAGTSLTSGRYSGVPFYFIT